MDKMRFGSVAQEKIKSLDCEVWKCVKADICNNNSQVCPIFKHFLIDIYLRTRFYNFLKKHFDEGILKEILGYKKVVSA